MADAWAEAALFPHRIAALAERLVAEEALFAISDAWPRDTGWSAANHRVRFGQSGEFELQPPTRPATHGELFAYADGVLERQLQLLEAHTEPGMVAIGNAVPYAADVGNQPSNGTLIYQEASASAGRTGTRRVLGEWEKLRL